MSTKRRGEIKRVLRKTTIKKTMELIYDEEKYKLCLPSQKFLDFVKRGRDKFITLMVLVVGETSSRPWL